MAIGTPIMALIKALLALFGYTFLCLKYRKNPIGGKTLETTNQNLDKLSLLSFISIAFIINY
ncbi:hypothetical protein GCM10022217_27360 [Chryseobacterium ginsenosidimutans]